MIASDGKGDVDELAAHTPLTMICSALDFRLLRRTHVQRKTRSVSVRHGKRSSKMYCWHVQCAPAHAVRPGRQTSMLNA